jgi:lysyl-tRNA synthetase class 2
VQDIVVAVVCLLKGKLWTGFFGLFIPIVGLVGALRLARPGSPWARRRYTGNPKKLARAERREERIDRTWRAWREAFFDLIAGKPHLPGVGAQAAAAAAPDAADPGAAAHEAAKRAGGEHAAAEAGTEGREEGKEMAGEGGLEPPIP